MFYFSRYDHINRPFLSWHQGEVPVQCNRKVSLIVTAKTNIPSAINFPGVVSLDDVEYSPGVCNVISPGNTPIPQGHELPELPRIDFLLIRWDS